ncbi:family 16 glycoside hydrolase [Mariniblastus fucicola]|nr:family 16 glycoside hydrolase [Mariniblastus fucicola]
MKSLLLFSLLLLTPDFAFADDSFEQLFNGKDLSGWAGNAKFWSVKDGVILGQTTKENPTEGNTFLVWQGGEVGDFVFKAKVRFEGNNTGVQYRSELVDAENFVVKGYQADLHKSPDYFGMLYAERWRGIVAQRFQKVEVGADGKPVVVGEVGDRNQKLVDSEWNELTIVAVGDRQIHQVNGITTMDLTDNHPEAIRKGILALQLHRGAPMTVEFKDIQLRKLSGDDAKKTIQVAIENNRKVQPQNDVKGTSESIAVDWVSDAPTPKWIWGKDDAKASTPLYLRHKFEFDKEADEIKLAKLYFTCDNGATVWLNGKTVGQCADWMNPVLVDAQEMLRSGENQFAVEATNRDGVAAFILKLEIETVDGETRKVVSSPQWKISDAKADGWKLADFDDSSWKAEVANLGEFGSAPWHKPEPQSKASDLHPKK